MRDTCVLVVEVDLERRACLDRQVRLQVGDVLGSDLERLARAARGPGSTGCTRGARGTGGAGTARRNRGATGRRWRRRVRALHLVGEPRVELRRGHGLHVEEHRGVEGAAQLGALATERLAGVGGVDGEVEGGRPPRHDVSLEQELWDVERVDDVLRAYEQLELDRPAGGNVHPAAVRGQRLELRVDSLVTGLVEV